MPDFRVVRDVTPEECPWLDHTMPQGALLWRCEKWDYGCITPSGTAVTANEDRDYPFFELPTDALEDLRRD